MSFNPLKSPLITQNPRFLSDISAWIEHIPFAFALVQLARPRLIVELGTHKGDSYCAFCQAVDVLQLDAKCFAIDTWAGDEQAGHYTSAVLDELRIHHDPRYARFSTLLQSTFDDAVARFDDASIDLLHIDGLHTYEAVKHDFNTWLPKLSNRAVVLFHDTAVTTGDFGVHKLWHELTNPPGSRSPNFEFLHASGLGILAVGGKCEPALLDFLNSASADPQPVRDLFAALGHRLELARSFLQVIAQSRRNYEQVVAWRRARGLPERDPFPVGLSLLELIQYGSAEFRPLMEELITTVRKNSNDTYALATDDETVRTALAELRFKLESTQKTALQPTPPNPHGGAAEKHA